MRTHRLVGAALFAFAMAVEGFAHAQSAQDKATAEALFNDGLKALNEGRLGEACPKFAESQRLDPAIGTALYLGGCYQETGRIASAWAMFHEALDLATKRNDAKRAAIAKDRIDKLSPSKLTITLGPGADVPGLEIKRDGVVVNAVTFGSALPLDGGAHVITATAPGRTPYSTTVNVPERDGTVSVVVPKWDDAKIVTPPPSDHHDAPPLATKPPPPAADSNGSGAGLRIAGLAIAGVGVVGLGLGSAFGLVAGAKYAESNTLCFNGTAGDADACPTGGSRGPELRSSAKTFAAASTGAFIAGGVLVAGGLVLFFVAPKGHSTALQVGPTVTAGGAGLVLGGRF